MTSCNDLGECEYLTKKSMLKQSLNKVGFTQQSAHIITI